MKISFCIYNFVDEKLPLQPWLTIRILAEGLVKRGHHVSIITDVQNPSELNGVSLVTVASLRGTNSLEVQEVLKKINPDALVFLPTPLSLATTSWLNTIDCRKIGFASYPFYNFKELYIAIKKLAWSDVQQYLRHILIPKMVWKAFSKRRVDVLISQSSTTTNRLQEILGNSTKCLFIPPGIDKEAWPLVLNKKDLNKKSINLLYLGSAIPIRGFDLALESLVFLIDEKVNLRILARAANETTLKPMLDKVKKLGLQEHVELVGGWIERNQLVTEIHNADAVLQPFLLVPSELPVTAMEVISCGTPVIGSKIDGMPSTIGPAGTVTKHGCPKALAETIKEFLYSSSLRSDWSEGCLSQRAQMQSWDSIIQQWENVLENGS